MFNSRKMRKSLKNLKQFEDILIKKAGVENYSSKEYTEKVYKNEGFKLELMFDIEKSIFFSVDYGEGRKIEKRDEVIFIGFVTAYTIENITSFINIYLKEIEFNSIVLGFTIIGVLVCLLLTVFGK